MSMNGPVSMASHFTINSEKKYSPILASGQRVAEEITNKCGKAEPAFLAFENIDLDIPESHISTKRKTKFLYILPHEEIEK